MQANDSNFEKIDLWQISHAKRNKKISSVETSVAKELPLVFQCNTVKDISFKNYGHMWPIALKYANEDKEESMTILTINHIASVIMYIISSAINSESHDYNSLVAQ